jgi:hypothetical protein
MQISANSQEEVIPVAEILQRVKRMALKILTSVKLLEAMNERVASSYEKRS